MQNDFDCGADLKTYNLEATFPKVGNLTAFLDADIIPYIVGYTKDPFKYLKAVESEDFYSHKYWLDTVSHAMFLINKWMTQAECDSLRLFVSGEENFRKDIAVTKVYKGDRVSEKPPFFFELKQWLVDFHEAEVSDNCEADDEISIAAWKEHAILSQEGIELWSKEHQHNSGFKILSLDKDLMIIPGMHNILDDGEDVWVNPIGSLDPVYREKEVNDYAYYPLFDGVPVPLDNCSYMSIDEEGKVTPLPYHKHPCYTGNYKASKNEVWFYSISGLPQMQDVFSRGVNKGKGKFKRVVKGKIKVDVIDRLKGTGIKFFYSQLLTGDTCDCYPGLPGVGATTAFEKLNNKFTEREMHHTVLCQYRVKYRHLAEEKMLEQARLAHMQTHHGELWNHLSESNVQTFPM